MFSLRINKKEYAHYIFFPLFLYDLIKTAFVVVYFCKCKINTSLFQITHVKGVNKVHSAIKSISYYFRNNVSNTINVSAILLSQHT